MVFNCVFSSLPIAVGALYVRKYFRLDSKAFISEMIRRIREEFEILLNKVEWMDDKTRQTALNKLKAIFVHIGYPDEILNNTKLEEYYENLDIDENNYLRSVLNINVFDTNYHFSKLRQPVNRTDWQTHANAAIVSASYYCVENSIGKSFSTIPKQIA